MVEFVNQIRKYPHRFLETCALFTSFIALGLSLGVVGPTLLDLQTQVQRDLNEVATALPARAGGYALGSFVMGFAFNKLSYLITASICMAITCFLTALMPHVYELYSLLTVFFLNGGFLGFFEAGANMQLLHLWGKENPPFMQALHLCYGVGALVVPLIAEPFLLNSELSQEEAGNSMILHTSHGFNGTTNITMPTTTTYPGISDEGNDPSNLRLVYPYSVVAGVLGFNCIYFFLLWKCYPKTEEHPSRKQPPVDKSIAIKNAVEEAKTSADDKDISMRDTKKNTKSNLSITFAEGSSSEYNTVCDANDLAVVPYKGLSSSTAASQGNKMSKDDKEGSIEMMPITLTSSFRDDTQESPQECELKKRRDFYFWKGFVIVLTVMFMHIYYGLEITFGSFLTTFAHESGLQLSKADGAHMTSLFWGTFTVLRLFTVFYIEYVGAEMNILLSLVVVLIANVLLVPFGNSNELCLWIGVGVIGLGTSSIWASLFGYLEEYFTVTSRIAAGMIVSAIVGEFVFPLIISNFVQDYPQVLLWVVLFCSVALTVIFLIMMFVMRRRMRGLIKDLPHLATGHSSH